MDLDRRLRTVIKTGKVVIGSRETLKMVRNGKAKLVIVASNCPEEVRREIGEVTVFEYPGKNTELGPACGKPFAISALAVIDSGDFEISDFLKEGD
ncbi:MAG: 50S ribosomal protein L30e [Candidatus Syntropharchaeia archaeon]